MVWYSIGVAQGLWRQCCVYLIILTVWISLPLYDLTANDVKLVKSASRISLSEALRKAPQMYTFFTKLINLKARCVHCRCVVCVLEHNDYFISLRGIWRQCVALICKLAGRAVNQWRVVFCHVVWCHRIRFYTVDGCEPTPVQNLSVNHTDRNVIKR